MALPKINTPLFELNLPSTGVGVKYRPFLVKEQKILLMAMESDDQKAMMIAIKQIINNCAVDFADVDKLPLFDLEYFFLKLRAKSIGEEIDLNLRHPNGVNKDEQQCDHTTRFKLNLMDVNVEKKLDHVDNILLDEESGIGIKMKYPTSEFAESMDITGAKTQIDIASDAIIACIDFIYDKDNVYPAKDHTKKELVDFIENLSEAQFQKVSSFFDTMPKLKHTINWKCTGCGVEDEVELEGLANFFG